MSDAIAISPLRPTCAIAGRKLHSLDGLRAIAILGVFLHHTCVWFPAVNPPLAITRAYLWLGFIGVDLFFVLSGFLITGILLDTREASNYFKGFYARRALRIFPLYYLVLIGLILVSQVLTSSHAPSASRVASILPLREDRWLYFCYLTNWLRLWKAQWGPDYVNILAHFWSLAVEEQFYFVWPLIVWMVRPSAIRRTAIALAATAAIVRLIWISQAGPQIAIQFATVARMDSLFVGAICASLYRDRDAMLKIRKWLPWIASLTLGGFLLGFTSLLVFPQTTSLLLYGNAFAKHTPNDGVFGVLQYGGYSFLALGFGALVLLCAQSEAEGTWTLRALRSRFLGMIGKYSYGIYVFHIPVLWLMSIYVFEPFTQRNGIGVWTSLMFLACAAVVTFLISALSYEFFERKILCHKRFFEPRFAVQPQGGLVGCPDTALHNTSKHQPGVESIAL
jgi:peptidoglycan/LPS O-acetylase OafA/YrhL